MSLRALVVAATFLSVAFAGCISGGTPSAIETVAVLPSVTGGPFAVVALVDTGINPYHVDFRDDSPLGLIHPSQYLPGYPADAIAVELTLDAPTLEDALEADAEKWAGLSPRTLYWFPGTKVSGYSVQEGGMVIFDTGHGSMTASRAAGNAYSLCPTCRIVSVQGFTGESVMWASQQPWIDAQSDSWSPLIVFQQADRVPLAGEAGLADAFELAATRQLVFGSAGNGIAGKGGVIGHPSFTRSTSGPRGVISVGGHDNGEVILWSGSWPHVVADACANWAAVGDSLDEYSPKEGGGTSSASPYAAGAAARIVLEARRLGGVVDGVENGVVARGLPTASGPFDDGQLTLDEVRTILMKTATARPTKTEHDGDSCGMTGAPYNTYPIAWGSIPTGVPSYALIGYGQVSIDSLALAIDVVRGEVDMPARPDADAWHAMAETMRDTYNDLPV